MTYQIVDIRDQLPRHATRKWAKRKQTKYIVVHCTAGTNQDPFRTAQYHIGPNHISKKGCPGIVYHDYINHKGTVYHCTDYDAHTWHASAWNKKAVGIVMAYEGEDISPPAAQYDSLVKQLVILCLYLKVIPQNIRGHRELPWMFTIIGKGSKKFKKWCPGKVVNLENLRAEITFRLQKRLAAEGLYEGAIDGVFGRKSKAALQAFKGK